MAVSLDEVSAGRLILGLGAGWHDAEHVAFGYPLDNRVGRFEEAMQIIAPLLRTGRGRLPRAGTTTSRTASLDPRGPGPAGPPDPHRCRRAADASSDRPLRGHVERPLPGRPVEARGAGTASDDACTDVGRDPATIETTVGEWIMFDDLAPSPDPKVNAVTGSGGCGRGHDRPLRGAGRRHLMLQCINPGFETALERLGDALAEVRRI